MSMLRLFPAVWMAVFAVSAAVAVAGESRQSVFDAMYQSPGNKELMLRYARLSAGEGDYEAAVATLERLLDLAPDNQEARLNLAQAYFALGQNAVAAYHLGIYKQRADLTPDGAAAVDALAREAASRDSGFHIGGSLALGPVRSSGNGNTGLSYSAQLRLNKDLGGPRPNSWDTLFRVDGRHYGGATTPNISRIFMRTGPSLALSDRAFGPRLRPYLELGSVNDPDVVEDGTRALLGVSYTQPVNGTLAVFGDLAYGRNNRSAAAGNADVTRVLLGADVQATPNLTFRLSLRHQKKSAVSVAGTDTRNNTARLDASYEFSPGFNRSGRDWLAQAYVQSDKQTSTGAVKDDFLTYGAAVKAFLNKEMFVRGAVRRVERDSTTFGQSRNSNLVVLALGWEF